MTDFTSQVRVPPQPPAERPKPTGDVRPTARPEPTPRVASIFAPRSRSGRDGGATRGGVVAGFDGLGVAVIEETRIDEDAWVLEERTNTLAPRVVASDERVATRVHSGLRREHAGELRDVDGRITDVLGVVPWRKAAKAWAGPTPPLVGWEGAEPVSVDAGTRTRTPSGAVSADPHEDLGAVAVDLTGRTRGVALTGWGPAHLGGFFAPGSNPGSPTAVQPGRPLGRLSADIQGGRFADWRYSTFAAPLGIGPVWPPFASGPGFTNELRVTENITAGPASSDVVEAWASLYPYDHEQRTVAATLGAPPKLDLDSTEAHLRYRWLTRVLIDRQRLIPEEDPRRKRKPPPGSEPKDIIGFPPPPGGPPGGGGGGGGGGGPPGPGFGTGTLEGSGFLPPVPGQLLVNLDPVTNGIGLGLHNGDDAEEEEDQDGGGAQRRESRDSDKPAAAAVTGAIAIAGPPAVEPATAIQVEQDREKDVRGCPLGGPGPAIAIAHDTPVVTYEDGSEVAIRLPEPGQPIDEEDAQAIADAVLPAGVGALPSFGGVGAAIGIVPYLAQVKRYVNALGGIVGAAFIGGRYAAYGGNISVMATNVPAQGGTSVGVARNQVGAHWVDPDDSKPVPAGLTVTQAVTGNTRGVLVNRPAAIVERRTQGDVEVPADEPVLATRRTTLEGATDDGPWIADDKGDTYEVDADGSGHFTSTLVREPNTEDGLQTDPHEDVPGGVVSVVEDGERTPIYEVTEDGINLLAGSITVDGEPIAGGSALGAEFDDGDGSDGDLVVSADTVLATSTPQFRTLEVQAGKTLTGPAGEPLYIRAWNLVLDGTIGGKGLGAAGGAGGAGSAGAQGGAAATGTTGTSGTAGTYATASGGGGGGGAGAVDGDTDPFPDGGAGGDGADGVDGDYPHATNGGAGGAGGAALAGEGHGTLNPATAGDPADSLTQLEVDYATLPIAEWPQGAPGSGGGGGAGGSTDGAGSVGAGGAGGASATAGSAGSSADLAGGGGGGGGGRGALGVAIDARVFSGAGSVLAEGGDGAAGGAGGANAGGTLQASGGGGGGGSAGSGAPIRIRAGTNTFSGTISAAAGTPGGGGLGGDVGGFDGGDGEDGGAGIDGPVLVMALDTL